MSKTNKKKSKKTNNIPLIIAAICFVIFVLISIAILTDNISWLDNGVYSIVSKMICRPMTAFFKAITMFCEIGFILIILALFIIFGKNKKTSSYIVVNSGLCVLINQFLKRIFVRIRPVGIALINQGGYSFPSGHSMMAVAFYGLLIYIINKSNLSKNKKTISTIVLSLLTLFMIMS